MRLFGRQVAVQLGRENQPGIEHTGLRITFQVKMTDGPTPNEAKIEIYNLARGSVELMQHDDSVIRLLTGYRSSGGVPRLIFEGNPVPQGVKLQRRGVDRILTVEAQDGGKAYRTTHVSESIVTPTTAAAVFKRLSAAFGQPLGNVDGVVAGFSFPHGVVLNGPARDEMDRIADLSGAQWQFRDGAIQIWPKGETTGEGAIVFSAAQGNLIQSPVPKDDSVEVTGLLAPSLRPGKPFRVESEQITGDYVSTEVTFKGDSGWSREFYTVAIGKRIA